MFSSSVQPIFRQHVYSSFNPNSSILLYKHFAVQFRHDIDAKGQITTQLEVFVSRAELEELSGLV